MQERLEAYGLSPKEAVVYIAALKRGKTTSYDLSQATQIKRSTIYDIVAALKHRGLLSEAKEEGRLVFVAEPPEALLRLLDEKRLWTEALVAELRSVQDSAVRKTQTDVFHGVTAVKQAALDMLNARRIDVYGASHVADHALGSYTANFARKRVERNIRMRALIGPKPPVHMVEEDVRRVTEIRIMPALKDHDTAYFIYGNKLLIVTISEPLYAIRIESKAIVSSQSAIFLALWRNAQIS